MNGPTPQTGALQFGNDRPGVFIRNEDCIIAAADLRKVIKDGYSVAWTLRKKLEELAQLLEGVK